MSSKASKTREIDFPLPSRGINLGVPLYKMPPGYSSQMNNILAYDTGDVLRCSSRPGLSKFFGSAQFGGGAKFCQLLMQVTLSTGTGTNDYILTAFAGTVYLQKPGDTSVTALTGYTFSTARRIEAAAYQDVIYFTDGLAMKKCTDLATIVAWTATAGSLPVAGGEYPRYMVEWRGRMVLSHLDKGTSGQIFWTALGDPTNFDYGAVFTPTIAVASTSNFKAGQMADAVSALIPINEDILLISTSHTLNKVVGDPADGGQMVPITDDIGILNQDAWCLVDGTLYFVGAGGFFKMESGGQPQNLSREVFNINFKDLAQVNLYAECVHDIQRALIWIFITGELTPWTTLHCVYDLTTGGFFPISFASTTGGDDELGGTTAPKIGPTKACTFDGTAGTNSARVVLIGCRDGYVRQFDSTVRNDDVAAMPQQTFMTGALQPGGATHESLLNGAYLVLGNLDFQNEQIDLMGADDPGSAQSSGAAETVTLNGLSGRRSPLGWRVCANSFVIKVTNLVTDTCIDIERLTCIFEPGPLVR